MCYGDSIMSIKNLRVMHLSTSHMGGAGIAARRLNRGLIESGIESSFISLNQEGFDKSIGELAIRRTTTRKTFGGITSKVNAFLSDETYFTLFNASATRDLPGSIKWENPNETIIHLHNWFNLITMPFLEKILQSNFRVVVTLHDQRFFTGGCHYSLDCTRFKINCKSCPMLPSGLKFVAEANLRKTKTIMNKYNKKLFFIAPSKWILGQAKSSNVLAGSNIEHIYNVHNDFKAVNRNKFKNGAFKIGVANFDLNSKLKNSISIKKIEQLLRSNQSPIEISYLFDYRNEVNGNDIFWSSIDCLMILSNADNSPNVIHEAKINGIPIIGSNVGGIPELLNNKYDFLIDLNSDIELQILLALDKLSANHLSQSANISLDYHKIVSKSLNKHIMLYQQLLKK
jgi:hypothetical protein